MTHINVHELTSKINSLTNRAKVSHEELSTPLHKAKTILDYITQSTTGDVLKSTQYDLLCIVHDLVEEAATLNQEEHDYIASLLDSATDEIDYEV